MRKSTRFQTTRKHKRASLGFTLIELLVVIGIVGILAGLLLPPVEKVRDSTKFVVNPYDTRASAPRNW